VVSSHLFQRVASFLQFLWHLLMVLNAQTVLISFREWLHSYSSWISSKLLVWSMGFSSLSESGFIPTVSIKIYREGLIWWSSHLFQRVASFLPVRIDSPFTFGEGEFSSLSESGFIPTALFLMILNKQNRKFSSLSESGFIPTRVHIPRRKNCFRGGSHLFQRVASFLRPLALLYCL